MRNRWIIASLCAALGGVAATGCKDITCGAGTIDRNGVCAPEDETVGSGQCGPFTVLQGDTCVPMFPPTECDPSTTAPETDPTTGVTTCVGTGGGGCSAPIACPTPATGKQSICGQLYDFETTTAYQNAGAMGSACGSGATTGPCALALIAVDSGTGGTLDTGTITIDDCGRYIVPDIDLAEAASPFLGVVVDDAAAANMGPGGITEATVVGTPKVANTATNNLDAYVVNPAMLWMGGPPISGGIFAAIFFAHPTGTALQAGVKMTKNGTTIPMTGSQNASYFTASDTLRGASDSIDNSASVTGMNGTALITGAAPTDGLVYAGSGGVAAGCQYTENAGTDQSFVVFVEEFRPTAISGMTCN